MKKYRLVVIDDSIANCATLHNKRRAHHLSKKGLRNDAQYLPSHVHYHMETKCQAFVLLGTQCVYAVDVSSFSHVVIRRTLTLYYFV